ncbi:MAG TPA: NAD-dependent succinate-semialdehyde dehydrogenase [Candidatus Limnocylindria bacterium]|nr:NAD-dependent succinate-semialdehyde dehydrogenase [Candidatus Limnocylindria bacterium]
MIAIDPATEEELGRFDVFTADQVEGALAAADAAFQVWRPYSVADRSGPLAALARQLRANADSYARLITIEMGKPITEARAELEKCAWACDYYAEHAATFLRDELMPSSATRSLVSFEPLGVVLAIMPWNFPFWQVFRFAAAAVMAGNAVVLKHASNVPQCALAIEGAFAASGFPAGLFRTVLIPGGDVEPLVADERVRAITLTGSSQTGSRIAELAGRALKKCVLELGGSDPFIVLPDADVAVASAAAARARNQNAGQSCIAAKRFIAVGSIAEEFEDRFAREVSALRVGDPGDASTQVGPLARADLRDALERQVTASVRMGGRVLAGGRARPGRGFFYEPTVLAQVTGDMPVWREETFGPVAAIRRVADVAEAIAVANDSIYGLGASVWTRDATAGEWIAREIESGAVFVNGIVASDPRLPFGGTKRSGYGRELGIFGIREFTNIKTIWIGPPR